MTLLVPALWTAGGQRTGTDSDGSGKVQLQRGCSHRDETSWEGSDAECGGMVGACQQLDAGL